MENLPNILAEMTAAKIDWSTTNVFLMAIALLLLVILGLLVWLAMQQRRQGKGGSAPDTSPLSDSVVRSTLARNVMILSLGGVVLLSICVLWSSATNLDTAKFVFGAILPLLGTWVGTIMAFYFSRENLAAATSSVATFADRLNPDPLETTSVQQRMRKLPDIKYWKCDVNAEASLLLTELLASGAPRLPILNDDNSLRYLVYTAVINEYRGRFVPPNAANPPGGKTIDKLSLADLVADQELKKMFQESWACVGPGATLAEAKRAMLSKGSKCNDIFVTTTGDRAAPVVGWVTDNKISENSKA